MVDVAEKFSIFETCSADQIDDVFGSSNLKIATNHLVCVTLSKGYNAANLAAFKKSRQGKLFLGTYAEKKLDEDLQKV